jgi:hypothetical protein
LLTSYSLGSVKKILAKCKIKTVRNSGLTDVQKGAAILKAAEDDPLGRWGARKIKEKLALGEVHIARSDIYYRVHHGLPD